MEFWRVGVVVQTNAHLARNGEESGISEIRGVFFDTFAPKRMRFVESCIVDFRWVVEGREFGQNEQSPSEVIVKRRVFGALSLYAPIVFCKGDRAIGPRPRGWRGCDPTEKCICD